MSVPRIEPIKKLTKREEEVVRLVAQGYTNKEISSSLFIAVNTTKTHTDRIFKKLNVNNRVKLTLWYYNLLFMLLLSSVNLLAQKTYLVVEQPNSGDMRLCADIALTSCSPVGSNMGGTQFYPTATRAGTYVVEERLDDSPTIAPILWKIEVKPGPAAKLREEIIGTNPVTIAAGGTSSMSLRSVITDQYGNVV